MRFCASVLLAFWALCASADSRGIFRFWRNMDDAEDGRVNGVADRENFFPVLLDLRQFLEAWPGNAASYRLRGDGALNVAWTGMSRSYVWALYREDDVVAGEDFNLEMDSAPVIQVTSEGLDIPSCILSRIRGGHDVVMACEARPDAGETALWVEVSFGNSVIFRSPLKCFVSDVRDMYHWINLRHVSGQTEVCPTMTTSPRNADWDESLPHVFFVHGANVDENESRIWAGKMFKRLYLSGAKMRFHGVSWCSRVAHASDYHLNASNSFDVASHLAANVNAFSGRKVVIAHSLGTMLTANAIQFFGMQVDKVIFLNSAIPSEAFDPDQFNVAVNNPLVHDAWRDYPSVCWTSLYHALGYSGSGRTRLTWCNRYIAVAPLLFNMYSSGDEVLSLYEGAGNPGWSDGIWSSGSFGARYSWQKQELWKGRAAWYAGIGTTHWSGWGFKANVVGGRVWTAASARAISDPMTFATNTVFNPFPSSITNSALTDAEINAHLTQGVPALSRALGNIAISADLVESMDLNADDDQQRPNGWPNDFGDFGRAWLHSDIKDVPYFYTYPKFDMIIKKGGLK